MGLFDWLVGVLLGDGAPVATALLSAGLLGAPGLRPLKLALGLAVGAPSGSRSRHSTRTSGSPP
jgi:hypothetical protein